MNCRWGGGILLKLGDNPPIQSVFAHYEADFVSMGRSVTLSRAWKTVPFCLRHLVSA